jgi:hypothetical protein
MEKKILDFFSGIGKSLGSGKLNLGSLLQKAGVTDAINRTKAQVHAQAQAQTHTQTYTFQSLPKTVAELQALPEAAMNDVYAVAALSVLALMRFEESRADAVEMLNFLKGPDDMSPTELQQISDRFMDGKFYKVRSFFEGATPANNYSPAQPFRIQVSSNPYSFENEGWATLYMHSGGADNPRPIRLRMKPSTGQWFMVEIQYLGDIRIPAAEDKWR